MIDRNKSRFQHHSNSVMPLARACLQTLEEGTAMVHVTEDGIGKVAPATGVAGEIFAGFATMRPSTVDRLIEFYTATVDSAVAVLRLQHATFVSGVSLRVLEADGSSRRVTVAASGAPSANEGVLIDGGLRIKLQDADKGKTVEVLAEYVPTSMEAAALYGMAPCGVAPSLGGTATMTKGFGQQYYTNVFDASADWSMPEGASVKLYLTAGGKVTTTQTDSPLTEAVLIASPRSAVSSGASYVGLSLR